MMDYDQEYLQLNRAATGMTFTRAASPEVEEDQRVKTKKKGMQGIGGNPSTTSGVGGTGVRSKRAADLPPGFLKNIKKKKGNGSNGNGSQTNKWDPDNDGDDDSNAKGDTDKDYWTKSGKQKKSVPGKPLPKK